MSDTSTHRDDDPDVPASFLVEMKTPKGPIFLVCKTVQIIPAGHNWGGLSQEAIAEYIARNRLDAAPLPGRPLESHEFRSGPSI